MKKLKKANKIFDNKRKGVGHQLGDEKLGGGGARFNRAKA